MASKLSNRLGEQVAYELLKALIPILIRFRVTPGQLNKVSRVLLVRGLAQEAKLRNGRVNQSQISAATGLSRAEVRRCLRETVGPYGHARLLASSKADQVILGWLHDKRYCLRPGRPAPLPYAGSGSSFVNLVRDYGGDVPPRAMTSELSRRELVRFSADRICLRTRALSESANAYVNMNAHLNAIKALAASIGVSPTRESDHHIQFVSIPARDDLEVGVIRQRAEGILDGATAALRSLQESPIVGGIRRKRVSVDLKVAVVLTEVPVKRGKQRRAS